MAVRAGEAFIAVGPNFKGWRAKQEAFVKSNLKAVKIPAELDVDTKKPIIVPPIKDPVIRPKVDQSRFRRGIGAIEKRLNRLGRRGFLINIGIAASPLLSPVAGAAAGGALAGTAIGASVLGGAGAFAAVGARSLGNISDRQSAGQSLTAGQSKVAGAKASAGAGLDKLAGDPRMLGALASGFTALGKAVAPLRAFLLPVSDALGQVFGKFGDAAASAGFKTWAADFGAFSGTILRDAGAGIMNLGRAFGSLLTAFMPLSTDMSSGLVDLTDRFATWSAGLSKSEGFQSFVSYVQTNGPLLLSTIGNLGSALIAIGAAVAPLGAKLLAVVNAVAPLVANFAQAHPLLIQVAAAFIATQAAMAAFPGPTRLITGLLGFLTKAFIRMSIAMLANPLGLVIVALVALGVGLVVAYKKSETFRKVVDTVVGAVVGAFKWLWREAEKIFGWLGDQWQKLVDLFSTPLKPRMDAANKTKDPNNSSGTRNRTGRTPNYYGTGDGNARGTNSWKGGLTWVGEKGPELAWLPRGTAITPNNRIGDLRATAGAFSIPVGRSKSMKVGDLRGGAASLAGNSGGPMRMRIVNFDHMKDYIDLVAEGQVSDERDFAGTMGRMNR